MPAVPLPSGVATLHGRLDRRHGRWLLADARPVRAIGRRRVLEAAPLLCLAAAAPGPDAKSALADTPTTDLHSHAAQLIFRRADAPFTPLAAPMTEGGLAVCCLAIVADQPTLRIQDGRIHATRDPTPGELYAHSQRAFARLHRLVAEQGLAVVTTADQMRAARSTKPSVVVSAEGGDFLEGNPDRVDEAVDRWQLRHLQLTHYRVNELGDIQTEPPVHGGLTEAGAAVIRRCNARGVVVDVAHGTIDLVRAAAAVTTKPLVLSHTSLTTRPATVHPADHARTRPAGGRNRRGDRHLAGGSLFPDMAALAGAWPAWRRWPGWTMSAWVQTCSAWWAPPRSTATPSFPALPRRCWRPASRWRTCVS